MFLICWDINIFFILNLLLFHNTVILIWQLTELTSQNFIYAEKLCFLNQNLIDIIIIYSFKSNSLSILNIILNQFNYNCTVKKLWFYIKNYCEVIHFDEYCHINTSCTFIFSMQSSSYQSEEWCLFDIIIEKISCDSSLALNASLN